MKQILVLPLCAALLGASAAAARADELVLRNGRTLEGKVTEGADTVTYERSGLTMEIRRDEVKEIRRTPTAREEYARRAAGLAAAPAPVLGPGEKDPRAEGHHRLGLWCAEKGLAREAREQQEKAIALDPDHASARRALGYMSVDGKWRLESDVMAERGLVKTAAGWVTPAEAEKLAAGTPSAKERARQERKALDAGLRKSLNRGLRLVADADPAVRAKGEEALLAWAKEAGDPDFEARVPEVRAYYDRVHEEIASARALLTVRAQLVTLKRPIPRFTTSLGAASSPVTLQLPELSVVSVNTTAVVPLEIDEE
ncbi:MAG: hypothetical protein L6R43_14165 [Planctomycetes bacterium]|nr:hypothetical protein [Planctomycetota bacterium]